MEMNTESFPAVIQWAREKHYFLPLSELEPFTGKRGINLDPVTLNLTCSQLLNGLHNSCYFSTTQYLAWIRNTDKQQRATVEHISIWSTFSLRPQVLLACSAGLQLKLNLRNPSV